MKILLIRSVDPCFQRFHEIFLEMGHEAEILDAKSPYLIFTKTFEALKPDFVFINNVDVFNSLHNPDASAIEEFLVKKAVPTAIWDFEAPHFAGGPYLTTRWRIQNYLSKFFFFSVDSFWVEEYQRQGILSAYLPFGVDERMQNFKPDSSYAALASDLTHVGTCPIGQETGPENSSEEALLHFFLNRFRGDLLETLYKIFGENQKNKNDLQTLDNQFAPLFFELLRFDIENVLEFRKIFFNLCEKIYELFPQFFSAPTARVYLEARFQVLASQFQTSLRLKRLIPLQLQIYGEGGWNALLPEYPKASKRLTYPEMYAVFRYSKMIFCHTKKFFVNNAHERIFHILGAGGFPLSDFRIDLEKNFAADEVVSYKSLDEARDLIHFYSNNESARQKIARKGNEKVFQKHTYRKRMEEVISVISKTYGLHSVPSRTPVAASSSNWIEKLHHDPKIP